LTQTKAIKQIQMNDFKFVADEYRIEVPRLDKFSCQYLDAIISKKAVQNICL
jgi:hypothetical protein